MMSLTIDTTVANIVKDVPKAGDLFRELRIDFCCGGKIPLHQAVKERGLDVEEVMAQVLEVEKKQVQHDRKKPSSLEPMELIVHIQEKYHAKLREELPALTPYVTKLVKVHGERYPHIIRVNEIFKHLKRELLEHTDDEDNNVFPLIKDFFLNPSIDTANLLKPHLTELEDEHENAGNLLKELNEITNNFQPPEEACGTHRLVLKRLADLEADTFHHIHLENNVLFDRVRQTI
ncbi:iron-sulfur cluster repair di-iron protein [Paenisporosarcina sp. TG20]|uniref:iron-sulfur cluster repair di-iron protein n=1 Tax=Paenisporosarcina sp. TG20 TaxID=1211706 RepID=UPI00031DB088|nr:iron-sulfur cluster repair di-iron protein [Paenisporosarcina sp. TG20]